VHAVVDVDSDEFTHQYDAEVGPGAGVAGLGVDGLAVVDAGFPVGAFVPLLLLQLPLLFLPLSAPPHFV